MAVRLSTLRACLTFMTWCKLHSVTQSLQLAATNNNWLALPAKQDGSHMYAAGACFESWSTDRGPRFSSVPARKFHNSASNCATSNSSHILCISSHTMRTSSCEILTTLCIRACKIIFTSVCASPRPTRRATVPETSFPRFLLLVWEQEMYRLTCATLQPHSRVLNRHIQ
jgi:hypothetical protein